MMHDESAVRASAAADDAFGADMYQLLTEEATDTVFSPVSVASALRTAWCGARGNTATELAHALHLKGSPDTAADGLLPPRSISSLTRLVLANAVYLKAAWIEPFS